MTDEKNLYSKYLFGIMTVYFLSSLLIYVEKSVGRYLSQYWTFPAQLIAYLWKSMEKYYIICFAVKVYLLQFSSFGSQSK